MTEPWGWRGCGRPSVQAGVGGPARSGGAGTLYPSDRMGPAARAPCARARRTRNDVPPNPDKPVSRGVDIVNTEIGWDFMGSGPSTGSCVTLTSPSPPRALPSCFPETPRGPPPRPSTAVASRSPGWRAGRSSIPGARRGGVGSDLGPDRHDKESSTRPIVTPSSGDARHPKMV